MKLKIPSIYSPKRTNKYKLGKTFKNKFFFQVNSKTSPIVILQNFVITQICVTLKVFVLEKFSAKIVSHTNLYENFALNLVIILLFLVL